MVRAKQESIRAKRERMKQAKLYEIEQQVKKGQLVIKRADEMTEEERKRYGLDRAA